MPEETLPAIRQTAAWLIWLSLIAVMAAAPRQAAADEWVPAEDDSAQEGSRGVAAGDTGLRTLLEYYKDSLEAHQYQEAETAAKQRIEYLFRVNVRDGAEMANALMDLATAQRLNEKFEAAIQNYAASVSLLEQGESMLSEKLVDPLRGLGDTYVAFGQPDRALPVLGRALHLSHVSAGPHNLAQVEILDAIIQAETAATRPDAALSVVDRMAALYTRRFGTDSEEMLPVLARRVALLNSLGRHQDERLTLLDVVRIIEGHRGKTDVGLIDAYSSIGRTYLHEVGEVVFRSEPTGQTGETFLKRAVDVARNSPDASSLMLSQTLIQLADYYTVMNAQDKARQNYRSAWDILSRDAGYSEHRRKDLEEPVVLIRPKLDRMANFGYRSAADRVETAEHIEGYMVARFTVNERGRVTDIEIVEADPEDFTDMRTRVQRVLRESVFRPRYVDGNPVGTENQLFRHDFLYVD